ncbi:beta-propeller fold lactonase family protein [Marinimicrobium sp. ABcell2]|uniref:beta-propeller fold lactonase family protein n=1 Tax=Marinimicrobium sp. ABcell2 TaxID=3069751 RepID=UPI0027AFEDE5|nr:beta-propeller fold lactonase family protein [Marinimicrobium sp. ABcell2]MDQ2075969.1 beta-propeller fold lactonase family protein [Marinimicrobium sp. ABcell2]
MKKILASLAAIASLFLYAAQGSTAIADKELESQRLLNASAVLAEITGKSDLLLVAAELAEQKEALVSAAKRPIDAKLFSSLNELTGIAPDGSLYSGIHLITHGRPGKILLGERELEVDELARLLDRLLLKDGVVYLYGCDIAGNIEGTAFVDSLARQLGRPVIASANSTGNRERGGDWELEYSSMALDAEPLFAQRVEGFEVLLQSNDAIVYIEHLKQGDPGVDWMSGASDPAVSPDGRHVYVAAFTSSAINIFSRNAATGELTPAGAVVHNMDGVQHMQSAFSVDISPDGKHVYVGSPNSHAVVVFARNENTGQLTFVESKTTANEAFAVGGFIMVSVSPDGKSVYGVGGGGGELHGLVVFDRNPETGRLTYVEEHIAGQNGNKLTQVFSPTASPINNIDYSAAGDYLYITSTADHAVSVYARNTDTGSLTLEQVAENGINGVQGIQAASSLVVSPDENFVYVSGQGQHAVSVFSRDKDTGHITYVEHYTNGTGGISTMEQARSLAMSPDGRYLYVSAIQSNAITVFERNVHTGTLSLAASRINGEDGVLGISAVSGMVTDPLNQNLYSAGQGLHAIAVFSLPIPGIVLASVTASADESGPAVTLDDQLLIFDSDDTHLQSGSVTIESGFKPGDQLHVTTQGGVTADYDADTGVLTLTGSATLETYRDILRSVSFQAGPDPDIVEGETAERKVAFRVNDGDNESAAAIVTVTVHGISGAAVTSVAVPANGTYIAGQNLNFTINTSENVTVNTGGGTPRIALTIGATTHYALYLSGSGTSALVFRYTVQTGDNDNDGIAVAAALEPNGGTLLDGTGNTLSTTLNSVGDTNAVFVNTATPTVTPGNITISGATGANGAYRIGDTVTAIWDNTADGDNNSLPVTSVTVNFSEFGGSAALAASNDNGTWIATYDIVPGSIDGTDRNVSVSATNANGTTIVADTTNATVDNIRPIVTDANINLTGATGTNGAFIIGNTVTATWDDTAGGDNNGDTSAVTIDFSQFGGSAIAATNNAGVWTATFDLNPGVIDAPDRNISVTATDDAGNQTTTAGDHDVSVNTIAPQVSAGNIVLDGASGTGGTFIAGDTLTVTWDNSAAGDNNSQPIAGVTVNFSAFGGGSAVAASSSGDEWSASLTLGAGLEGTNLNASVTAITEAGNQRTTASTSNVSVDTQVPDAPGVSFDQAPITSVNADNISLTLSGAEVDTTANYSISSDGGGTPITGSATITDPGQTLSGIDVSGLPDGTLTVSLTLTDAAGNVSDPATATVAKDAHPAEVLSLGMTDGHYAEGDQLLITVELNKNVTVTGTDATLAIDIGPDTRSAEFVSEVDGLLSFRYIVQTSDNTDTNGVTVLANGIGLNGTTIEDSAGNSADLSFAQQSFANVQVDTIAPDEPVVTAPTQAIDVNTDAFEITGTMGENGVTVRLYADTNQDGTPDDLNAVLGTATVTGGQWLIEHTLLQNTDNPLVVVAQDAAGNRSAPVVVPIISHDNIAPDAPEDLTLDPASDSGASDSDGITNITELVISGTGEVDSTITLTSDLDDAVGTTTVDSDGDWEITTDSLSDGEHQLTATATDAAGNVSAASDALTVTVDTEAPVISAIANQHISLAHGSNPISFTLADNVTDAETIDLAVVSNNPDVLPEANIDLGGSGEDRSILLMGVAPGLTEITLTSSDSAGNSGSISFEVLVNSPPLISGTAAAQADRGQPYAFQPAASDPNGGTLIFAISNAPTWADFDPHSGLLSGTPTEVGTHQDIVISVSDGLDSVVLAPFSIEVLEANQPPIISGTPDLEAMVSEPYSFVPTASDPDGNTLTFSAQGLPSWLSLDTETGALTGTPGASNEGSSATITLSVSDGELSASLPAFTLAVVPFVDLEPPQLNAPADRIIDARTLFTRITVAQLLGLPADASAASVNQALAALATDNVDGDGCCSPTVEGFEDGAQRLRPGHHEIIWRAQDSAGNEAEAVQVIHVRPMVSLSKDQIAVPGSEVSFRVILNGTSPFYPLELPYTLDSATTARADEHDLTDGTVVFDEGETEKTVTLRIDDVQASDGSLLVVRLDDREQQVLTDVFTGTQPGLYNLNSGASNRHRVLIREGNVPPRVRLYLNQSGNNAALIAADAGTITVTSTVFDPNVGDSHSFDWSGSDNSITALANNLSTDTLSLDPADLSPGRYTLQLVVTDSAGNTGRALLPFRVAASLPALDPNQDSNNNGIDDLTEGLGDQKGNGIPDYLDATPSANVLPQRVAQQIQYLLECDPGVRCRIGSRALMSESGGVQLLDEDFEHLSDLPADTGYQPVGGVFDFEIHDLLESGQSVRVVVPQRAVIPENAVYRKLINGHWQTFVEDEHNALHSASGEEGYCPAPGGDDWQSGLIAGYWCVQLTIEDGGPNDADGEADGSISDPGAVSRRLAEGEEPEPPVEVEPIEQITVTSSRRSGHSGLWLWLLMLGYGLRQGLTTQKQQTNGGRS